MGVHPRRRGMWRHENRNFGSRRGRGLLRRCSGGAGYDVAILAHGAHLDAIRTRGIEVRTPEGSFTVAVEATDEPKALIRIDYALVAVKNYSLPEIAVTAGRWPRPGRWSSRCRTASTWSIAW